MRQMTWITTPHMVGWACSDCGWAFKPSGPPRGSDLDEMKQNFERQREKEYASHVCAEYPKAKNGREASKGPR